ncbi:MAG: hypothetical protein WKF96_08790 [Solirubrobacteraceae bacterium]
MAATADQNRLRVVVDPDDDLSTLRAVRTLHARPFGQIVCEIDPTTTADALADYVLDALGKTTGAAQNPWPRARALLAAERIEHLVLARAHLLTYPALRRFCDCTAATETSLWLLIAGEEPNHAVVQLLELRPHRRVALTEMLTELAVEPPHRRDDLPAGGGLEFPWIRPPAHPIRRRADLARGTRGATRATILDTYDLAHDCVSAWDLEHPDATQQQAADLAYELCAAADSASEITVRAHAALHALTADGWNTRPALVAEPNHHRWWEERPGQYLPGIARAAQIADSCADPFDAALIALSALTRCRYSLRALRVRDLAENGAVIATRGIPSAVPPALRPPLIAQRLLAQAGGPDATLLPGPSQGRPNKTTMRRCYDRHGVPNSLRANGARDQRDDHDTAAELGLDGRDLLARLNPYSLFAH